MEEVGLFPPQGKNLGKPTNQNSNPINTGKVNEHLGKPHIYQSVEEVNEGSYQPPENQDDNSRGRPRSPDSEHRDRYRYDVTDRRYHFDYYDNRSDSSENNQLTASQLMEAKLFLDKISYFNGSNNKEALNFLAQCEEAAEKMKASETTVAWSKFAGRADVVMREESRQHEGTVTWELFQSMLIEHFYNIPSKERAVKLLNKLHQDPLESIGEYVQRGSEIIQVHSGKTNPKDISASQYGWNIVQGLTNVSIKNKIAYCISQCYTLSDVCKLIRQVRREMENREAFTGISAEPEENIHEVSWRQKNYNQALRGKGYFTRGTSRNYQQGSNYQCSNASRGSGYDPQGGNSAKKVGTINNPDVQCLLCGLKGHKVATCRKLTKAHELLRKDKHWYWNDKKVAGRNNASRYTRKHQINEVDEADSINNEDNQCNEEDVNTDYEGIEEINFPYSEFIEEEVLAYYNDN